MKLLIKEVGGAVTAQLKYLSMLNDAPSADVRTKPRGRLRMKSRCILIGVFLLTTMTCFSCAPSSVGPKGAATPSNSAGTGQSESEAQNLQPDDSLILQNERKVWDAFQAKNANAVSALLAEEALIVTQDGRFTKAEFLQLIPQFPEISSYSIEKVKIVSPDKDTVILTYESRYTSKEPEPRSHLAYQTTVWVNRGGKWLAIFNQETPLPR
jgi:hypothetical protein